MPWCSRRSRSVFPSGFALPPTVPNDPWLDGITFLMQSVWLDLAPGPLSLRTSPALVAALGR